MQRSAAVLGALLAAAGCMLWPWAEERWWAAASLEALESASVRQPHDERALYHLGVRRRQAGNVAGARDAFERAATLDLQGERAWLAWAETAAMTQGRASAYSILALFLSKNPNSADGHFALARLLAETDNPGESYRAAVAAAKLRPNDAAIWRFAGTQAMRKKPDDAVNAFGKAAEIEPQDWRNRYGLGSALLAAGKGGEAVSAFRAAVTLAEGEALAHLGLGKALLAAAETEAQRGEARAALLHALTLDPGLGAAHWHLGRVDAAGGNWVAACRAFRQAKDRGEASEQFFFDTARACLRAGETELAAEARRLHAAAQGFRARKQILIDRLGQNLKDAKSRLELARLYAKNGESEEAARHYAQLKGHPELGAIAARESGALPPNPSKP